MSQSVFNQIITSVAEYTSKAGVDKTEAMQFACETIHNSLENYDWVGFYLCSQEEKDMLVLGPYVGEPTDHLKIPFGKGICGQTAVSQKTFLIDDVSKEENYIACSIHVKSEIVVPMFKEGQMIGQIDIDSSQFSAFSEEDDIFLNKICQIIAEKF
jgi:GAF domain-containing protein